MKKWGKYRKIKKIEEIFLYYSSEGERIATALYEYLACDSTLMQFCKMKSNKTSQKIHSSIVYFMFLYFYILSVWCTKSQISTYCEIFEITSSAPQVRWSQIRP